MVGFCTTCKNRTQHLEITLPLNLFNCKETDTKTILLNYGSQDNLIDYIFKYHRRAIKDERLVVYHFNELGPFRMAHAKNMSHRLAIREGCKLLVNMDADNYTGPGFDTYIKSMFDDASRDHEPIFFWPNVADIKRAREGRGSFKGLNGRIGLTSAAFLKSGGYDERYRAWSPDDKDFDARLRRLGYKRHEIDEAHLQVVLHPDKMRFKEYPHAKSEVDENKQAIVMENDHTVVNYGRIGLGVVTRNWDPEPIYVNPIPTRIFGIGWHKTATTSLHTALTYLGAESAHWKSAPWAKAIWTEMNQFGKSLTVEKSFALTDMPIPPLYRSLDLAYPGAKFILTIRDERKWLESIRKHWDVNYNPFRAAWDTDSFSHRLHEILYGQQEFDADIFINRYRAHNVEVMSYFNHRPDDLLVMDMERGDGWEALCGFLGCGVPSIPYPVMFKSKTNLENVHE